MGGGPSSSDKFDVQLYECDIRLKKIKSNSEKVADSLKCMAENCLCLLCCCCCFLCIAADDRSKLDDNAILIQQLSSEIPALRVILEEQERDVGSDSSHLLDRKKADYERVSKEYLTLQEDHDTIKALMSDDKKVKVDGQIN